MLLTSTTMNQPMMHLGLDKALENCLQPSFSGYLEATRQDGVVSKLRFFLGRLVGDMGGEYSQQRWNRYCKKYLPSSCLLECDCWNHQLLEPLIARGQLAPQQMYSILKLSAKELLFELFFQEFRASESPVSARTTVKVVSEKLTDFEKAPSIRVDLADIWSSTLADARHMATSRELLEFHPSLCPVIINLEQISQSVSPVALERLRQMMDGQSTLWDVAYKLNKSILVVAKTISPFVQSGAISLVAYHEIRSSSNATGIPSASNQADSLSTSVFTSSSRKSNLRHAKILYVDDSSAETGAFRHMVSSTEHDFRAVNSPFTALSDCIEYKPDIIFLDLVMPVANGYEICAQLRRVNAFKNTPIIILTSNDGVVDRLRSKFVGSTNFISKPITREKLDFALRDAGFAGI